MEHPSDGPKVVQNIDRTCSSARHAQQPDHLAFELAKTHQIQGILEHTAKAAMVDRRPQQDSLRCLHFPAQPVDTLRVGVLISSSAEHEVIVRQVDQLRLGAELRRPPQGDLECQPRIATLPQAAADADNAHGLPFFVHCPPISLLSRPAHPACISATISRARSRRTLRSATSLAATAGTWSPTAPAAIAT